MGGDCFLCLNIYRTRRCTQCKVKDHRGCWVKYKKDNETQRCPQYRKFRKIVRDTLVEFATVGKWEYTKNMHGRVAYLNILHLILYSIRCH